MSRPIIVFPLCLALLAGCTTTMTPVDREATASTAPHPGLEWLEERDKLGRSLNETHGIQVQVMDDGALLLRLPAAEGFARDSVEPTPPLRTLLDGVAGMLAASDTRLKVLGHTDSIGSERYNLDLSIRRSEAVMDYLREQGVALGRLTADGRGEAEPIADNRTEAGRATNRRVEIIVRPARVKVPR